MFKKIDGKRRVRNVKIDGKPLDPAGKYKVAGFNYTLMEKGDGFTMFDDAKLLEETETLDCQVLRDYITDTLGGAIGNDYSDPYGDGRIEIIE
jgi:2',3'-cyclic-nucleotide 2'-phosphodiesterase (5'-nucleotidase family)